MVASEHERDRPAGSADPVVIDQDEREVRYLVEQIRRGSSQAFERLVAKYHNQVAALAYKMVGDYDEAADVAQIVFVKMSRHIWRYDSLKKFYTWLYRITVNSSIDYIRKHKRHRHESLDQVQDLMDSFRADPEFQYRRHQINGFISRAAERLNDKQRSAFILRDVQGCRIDEVAHVMNMPEATVRWYLHRARSRIRKELMRKCPQLLMLFGVN